MTNISKITIEGSVDDILQRAGKRYTDVLVIGEDKDGMISLMLSNGYRNPADVSFALMSMWLNVMLLED